MLSEPTYATPEPLATLASKAVLERIKSAADGLKATFACGGSVECSQPVRIFFWETGGDIQSEVRLSLFPFDLKSAAWLLHGENLSGSSNKNALRDLVAACSAATFGRSNPNNPREGADVLDPSYRKALKLDVERFATNINLSELGILAHIKTLMAPDAADVRAELYKLNIIHEGGELTVEHAGQQQTFDWSLTKLPEKPVLQWGAFYSDCKHEVHPVKSGARITVTYNLMAVKATPPPLQDADGGMGAGMPCAGINPTTLGLRQVLDAALETPGFLDQGGTLAFGRQHAYPHSSNAFLKTDFEPQLKGADACLVAVARDLGLKSEIKSLYKREHDDYEEEEYDSDGEEFSEEEVARRRSSRFIGQDFRLSMGEGLDETYGTDDIYGLVCPKVEKRWDLTWCHEVEHREVGAVYGTTGQPLSPAYSSIYSS
ncbi:MAG: hypothetical protein MMC33_009991 [Icmadophila ericetorum]|nr:hypothetical protein [Icmadophila ericetorum]